MRIKEVKINKILRKLQLLLPLPLHNAARTIPIAFVILWYIKSGHTLTSFYEQFSPFLRSSFFQECITKLLRI